MYSILFVPASVRITILGTYLPVIWLFIVQLGVSLLPKDGSFEAAMSDIQIRNGRDPSCFRSRDRRLIEFCDRKSHNTVMLLLGKRQLASTSSDMLKANLPPTLITTDSISPITDILEAKRNLRSLHLRMQEAVTRFVLLPTGKTPCPTFGC